MKTRSLFCLIALVAIGMWSFGAEAGKYGSSGSGSSRSSGGSSSSRSSSGSSGSSWGGRSSSGSSGSSWGGRSSSGSSSTKSTSSWGGRSESTKPSTPSVPSWGGRSNSGDSKKKESSPSFSGGKYGSSGFSSPTKTTESTKPKSEGFSSPYKSTGDSKKPQVVIDDKVRANRQEVSRRTYQEQVKATAPPKTEYVSPAGKTVKVDANSKTVQEIRSKPASYYQPEKRQERVVEHIHHYHYSRPYDWYYSQPSIYVGGGYSSAFWYMMMEWSAERRAQWLYHHQDTIDRNLYQQQLQNAELKARIAALEAQKVARNPNYVDKEFDKPEAKDLMYEQGYVEAAYNPTVVEPVIATQSPQSGTSGLAILVWVVIIGGVGLLLVYLLFVKRWNT